MIYDLNIKRPTLKSKENNKNLFSSSQSSIQSATKQRNSSLTKIVKKPKTGQEEFFCAHCMSDNAYYVFSQKSKSTIYKRLCQCSIQIVKSLKKKITRAEILALPKAARDILMVLIRYSIHYRSIHPSQSTIAKQVGVTRQHVNIMLKLLEEKGLIASKYVHRKAKFYYISKLFHNPFIRSALLSLLPVLYLLPIFGSLMSLPRRDDTNEFKNKFYLYSLLTDTKRVATDDQEIIKKRELLKQEELKRERLTMNVHQHFVDSDHPGDIYEAKIHKREVSKSIVQDKASQKSTKKLFPNALLGKAKKIWEEAQKGKITIFRARRELTRFKEDFPEGVSLFMEWYNSPEGIGFRKWITQS